MTVSEFEELFDKYDDDYLEFDRIKNPHIKRPDLLAFTIIEELVPGRRDIVSGAEHDEIWLEVDIKKLAKVITEEQVRTLICCGIRYDKRHDCLAMFV